MSRRAYEQLMGLETEMRESGNHPQLPAGHDDLMSPACGGATPSAFGLVGQRRFVRAQAAQAASKISWAAFT
jgi:hypothetical protein